MCVRPVGPRGPHTRIKHHFHSEALRRVRVSPQALGSGHSQAEPVPTRDSAPLFGGWLGRSKSRSLFSDREPRPGPAVLMGSSHFSGHWAPPSDRNPPWTGCCPRPDRTSSHCLFCCCFTLTPSQMTQEPKLPFSAAALASRRLGRAHPCLFHPLGESLLSGPPRASPTNCHHAFMLMLHCHSSHSSNSGSLQTASWG